MKQTLHIMKGFTTKQEVKDYLNSLTYSQVIELATDAIMENQDLKGKGQIVVTKEEMERITSMFRVRGFSADGTPINSGRKKKDNDEYKMWEKTHCNSF